MVESVFAMSEGAGQIVFPGERVAGECRRQRGGQEGQQTIALESDASQGEERTGAFPREVSKANLNPVKGFSGVDEADLESMDFPCLVPKADLGTGKVRCLIDHPELDAMHDAGGQGGICISRPVVHPDLQTMTEVIHKICDAELHAAQTVPASVEADGRLDAEAVFRDIRQASRLPSEGPLFYRVYAHRCLEANHPVVNMVGK